MTLDILTPVLALIVWTFVMWLWMYATRLPAMRAAGIDARKMQRKDELEVLPVAVKNVADNYNHLHEQPTIFYALAFYSHLAGVHDPLNVKLAWAYVALRVVHSMVQGIGNFVPLRFVVFSAGSVVLMIITARDVLPLLAAL